MSRPKIVNQALEDIGAEALPLEDYIDDLEKERDQLKAHINSINDSLSDLINESEGVVGLHKNGDIAYWSDLTEGGRLERWLPVVSKQCLAEHDVEMITKVLKKSLVAQALQTEWSEWCEDTGCIPSDFEIHTDDEVEVSFTASVWSDQVTEYLQVLCINEIRKKAQETDNASQTFDTN